MPMMRHLQAGQFTLCSAALHSADHVKIVYSLSICYLLLMPLLDMINEMDEISQYHYWQGPNIPHACHLKLQRLASCHLHVGPAKYCRTP